jgi:hypothetical protein
MHEPDRIAISLQARRTQDSSLGSPRWIAEILLPADNCPQGLHAGHIAA